MAEHLTRNEKVVGSIPTTSSKKEGIIRLDDTLFFVFLGNNLTYCGDEGEEPSCNLPL